MMKAWKKRGQVAIYITFMMTAIIILLITAFFAPLGVQLNTEFYAAGEEILLSANESIAGIQNADVRDRVYSQLDEAFAAQENNINVNADIFQYAWIPMLGLTALVVFLFTRRLTEYSQGGGFI